MLDDDRDPRIDDLPVDADTHNDVDLERAGQHRRRDLREQQLGQASDGSGPVGRPFAVAFSVASEQLRFVLPIVEEVEAILGRSAG